MLSPHPPQIQSRLSSFGRIRRLQPQLERLPSRHARLTAYRTPAAEMALVKAASRLAARENRRWDGLAPAKPTGSCSSHLLSFEPGTWSKFTYADSPWPLHARVYSTWSWESGIISSCSRWSTIQRLGNKQDGVEWKWEYELKLFMIVIPNYDIYCGKPTRKYRPTSGNYINSYVDCTSW